MLGWMAVACVEPPLLDRVATAYGESVVDSSTTAVGLFVSAAALVAEPCGADVVEDYTLVGEAYHAFRVTSPSVTVAESGERTYAYGIVAFEGDVGELTLTSDAGRQAWTARYSGEQGSFVANYAMSQCEVDEAGVGRALADAHGVFEMKFRFVLDAARRLQLRSSRAHLPGRQVQGAANVRGLLDQQHARAPLRGGDRRGQSGGPGANHDDVVGVCHAQPCDPSTGWNDINTGTGGPPGTAGGASCLRLRRTAAMPLPSRPWRRPEYHS